MKTRLPQIALAALALALAGATAAHAQFDFHVNLDTSALVSSSSAPFSLDFQLNAGNGSFANTVTLSNFTFDGGSATGTATIFGSGSGTLPGSVTLSASSASAFNEFYQSFASTTTGIHFDVAISQNSPGSIADQFTVAVLDNGLNYLASTAGDGTSLVTLGIGSANTLADVGAFATGSAGVVASATAVPEPATTAAGLGLVALALVGYFRLRQRAA